MAATGHFRHRVGRVGWLWVGLLLGLAMIGLVGCGGVNPTEAPGVPGTQPTPRDPYAGAIAGIVVASDGTRIAAALVETTDRQTWSLASGEYLLDPLPEGIYRVTARATGFSPAVRDGVAVRAGEITRGIDLRLTTGVATPSADFAILAVSPRIGTDQDEVDVLGHGFGVTPGQVTIGGRPVSVMIWTDTLIRIKLPELVETGVIKVVIRGESSHERPDLVFIAKPVATEVQPAAARPSTIVEIVGRNFHPVYNFNRVKLNGLDCEVLEGSTVGRLRVLMPANADTGVFEVRIEAPDYQTDGISTARVTIPPTMVHLSPKRSLPGITLSIYGRNFGDDASAVRVQIGDRHLIAPAQFVSFNRRRIQVLAPGYDVVPAGQSAAVRVAVNNATTTESFLYTAFNPTEANLNNYGVYYLPEVAPGGVLKIARLRPTDRLALVLTLEDAPNGVLSDTYTYVLTSILGNNRVAVPAGLASLLPAGAAGSAASAGDSARRASLTLPAQPSPANGDRALWSASSRLPSRGVHRWVDIGPRLRIPAHYDAGFGRPVAPRAATVRAALTDPAPASTTFWVLDPSAANPNDPANDRLASATLVGSGSRCLIYLDSATNTAAIASPSIGPLVAAFDRIYNTLATACHDGITAAPIEGNVDEQPRIVLLLTPKLNEGMSGTERILGLYHPRDKNPGATHSNSTEILYLWDRALLDQPAEFYGVCAHELAHMIYDHQKARFGVGSTWINEGLAVWAQDVVGHGFVDRLETPVDYVSSYLRRAPTVSLSNWPASAGLENYGGSYLFVKYLFQIAQGYRAIRQLERNNGASGWTDVESFVIDPLATASARLSGQNGTLAHFGMALYCDELGLSTSLPGFQPYPWQFDGNGRGDRGVGLRNAVPGVEGLQGPACGENPVLNQGRSMRGYSYDLITWPGGNDGDLEVTLTAPSAGRFHAWLIYHSTR